MIQVKFVDILGVPIASLSLTQIPQVVIELIEKPGKKTFFYVNAHCLSLASMDSDYRQILRKATLVYSGGVGPVLASRLIGYPLKERTPTPDFIDKILAYAQARKWLIYLVGTNDASLKTAVGKLQEKFPKLKISGFHSGYFNKKEEKRLISDINHKNPTIILVGMGTPKQEKWIRDIKDKTNAKVFWAVGAMFDVISGIMPRAPIWMQKMGLEWLFRFLQEPKRLWRRYLIGNARFILQVLFKNHD